MNPGTAPNVPIMTALSSIFTFMKRIHTRAVIIPKFSSFQEAGKTLVTTRLDHYGEVPGDGWSNVKGQGHHREGNSPTPFGGHP